MGDSQTSGIGSRQIALGHLSISDSGKQYVNDCLANNRLSYGKYTANFEKQFASLHGSRHGIFCNSGTSALQIALATMKELYHYQDGDEIIVPALTFIATSNVVIQNNLKPIFVDVNKDTFNIDPEKIEEKITPRTRAIIPVHLFRLPCDMPRIMEIARRRKLQVIEDSCETMFAGIDGQRVGSFGDAACFSTYVAHLIVGGVGGIVTTEDVKIADLCRSFLQHGRDNIYLSIDDDDLVNDDVINRRYSFARVGYSYRATEIEAAIALSELERWKENIGQRRKNAVYLISLLKDLSIQLPITPVGYEHSFMMFPLVYDGNRARVLRYLESRGIETRYLFPLLSQPVYRRLFPGLEEDYPVAKKLSKQGFFVGMHQGLTSEDIEYIAQEIKCAIRS